MKKVLSLILSTLVLCSMTGCSGETASTTIANTTTEDDDVVNPVDISDIELDMSKDIDISGTVLRYLGCYDITKAGDIKPAVKYLEENYDCSIEVEIVSSLAIMEKMSTYISSGNSPDLVDVQDDTFPYYIAKNAYEPLDGYFDLNAPQWIDCKPIIESYAIGGKCYYVPWAYSLNSRYLIYNRGLFTEYGIDDPKELYDAGTWTWDAMYKCMTDFTSKTSAEEPLGLYGSLASSFIATSGESLITYKDGVFASNINSPAITRAQNFLEKLRKEGLSAFAPKDSSSVDLEPIINGSCAFQAMGGWIVADFTKRMAKDETLDIFFVPMPRDPSADKYYYSYTTFGYMVPAGSEHVQAAAAFIDCCRLGHSDPELLEVIRASEKRSKKYTDEMQEFMASFEEMGNFESDSLILEYAYGIDSNLREQVINPMFENMAFDNSEEQTTWTVMRDSYSYLINESVDTINSTI